LHRDDNKLNNHYSNLYWGDQQDNADDRERNGHTAAGALHGEAVKAGQLASGYVGSLRYEIASRGDRHGAAVRNGFHRRGRFGGRDFVTHSSMTEDQVVAIYRDWLCGVYLTKRELAACHGVCENAVVRITLKYAWCWLTDEIDRQKELSDARPRAAEQTARPVQS